ncbi:MAG: S-layer homology domain-containing protein [Bacillota bacterium]
MIRKTIIRLAVLFSLALLAAFPSPAYATLSVGGAVVDKEVSPGESCQHTILVSLAPDDVATDMQVKVEGLGQQLDGVTKGLPPDQDTSPYSARSFITLDRSSIRVQPGTTQTVYASINVPSSVGAGGRYAVIRVFTVPSGDGMLTIAQGVTIPVKLTIKGTALVHTGEITEFSVGSVAKGKPVDVVAVFKNTGNHHYKVKGEIRIANVRGETLAAGAIPLTAANVIPTMSRELKASLMLGDLPDGLYTVRVKVMKEDGTELAQATSNFIVYPRVTFSDITGYWAQDDIEIMAGQGIAKGIGNDKFDPEGRVTRAQFAAFLIRALGIEETQPAQKYFKDVYSGAWYYRAVETAYANGLVSGYSDGRFKPNTYITREELAAMVLRGLTKSGKQVAVSDVESSLAQFTDQARIGAWARQAAAAAVQEGLLKGRGGSRFAPKENATRAEAVVMLKRMLVSLEKLAG